MSYDNEVEDEYDDFEMGSGYADGKSAKAIADENSFPPVPKGRNDFYLKKIEPRIDPATQRPQETRFEAWSLDEDGKTWHKESYLGKDGALVWALASDPKLTLKEFIRFVPDDEDDAEMYATTATKKGGKIGMDYNKLRHMLAALGFDTEDGSIPLDAQSTRNWKFWPDGERRIISLDIADQMDPDTNYKKPKCGANGEPFKQVKLFSHMKSEDTLIRLGLIDPPSEEEQAEAEGESAEDDVPFGDDIEPGDNDEGGNDEPEPEPEPEPKPAKTPVRSAALNNAAKNAMKAANAKSPVKPATRPAQPTAKPAQTSPKRPKF